MITVIGGKGFIGAEIVSVLKSKSLPYWVPDKNDEKIFELELGVVVYVAGHGDCQNEPFKVLDSNTTNLSAILQNAKFEKIIYISSTRLYLDSISSLESDDLIIGYKDKRRLFNLTKAVAEEMIKLSGKRHVILRPGNVYGGAIKSPLFLPSIVRDAISSGKVKMFVPPSYAKDYVSVKDVSLCVLEACITTKLDNDTFNVGSGVNVSAIEIANVLQSHTQCEVEWINNISSIDQFPVTNIEKLKKVVDYYPTEVLVDLLDMINDFRDRLE
jgi:nucleoside-diphosphate-sugar epimerase